MKKNILSIGTGILISLIALTVITAYYPILDDLLIENPFWNGLSEFYQFSEPIIISDFEELAYSKSGTLFIIGPYKDFQKEEADYVDLFLKKGGRVILCDDYGSGSQLLAFLRVNIRFEGGLVRDEIFKDSDPVFPRVDAGYYGIDYLVLNYPTYLIGNISDNSVVWSSFFSYSIDTNEKITDIGLLPIIAEVPFGKGELITISDSSIFINSMIDKGGNKQLLETLIKGDVLFDEVHGVQSNIVSAKSLLAKTYTLLRFYEIRYSLLVIVLFGFLRVNLYVDPKPIDPIEEVLHRHPEYDRKKLEWLEMERRKVRENT
jgi:hypothetical protein